MRGMRSSLAQSQTVLLEVRKSKWYIVMPMYVCFPHFYMTFEFWINQDQNAHSLHETKSVAACHWSFFWRVLQSLPVADNIFARRLLRTNSSCGLKEPGKRDQRRTKGITPFPSALVWSLWLFPYNPFDASSSLAFHARKPPATGDFPSQLISNAESVSMRLCYPVAFAPPQLKQCMIR